MMRSERLLASRRADGLGWYFSSSIAAMTLARVFSLVFGSLLSTRDTVLMDTPAWAATSSTVTEPVPLPLAMPQHSTMLTASPPRAVSLYLVFMSAPVSRMVLMTESSDT